MRKMERNHLLTLAVDGTIIAIIIINMNFIINVRV
jgi:hypothetical protein